MPTTEDARAISGRRLTIAVFLIVLALILIVLAVQIIPHAKRPRILHPAVTTTTIITTLVPTSP